MTSALDRLADVAREMGTLPAAQADTGTIARVRDNIAALRASLAKLLDHAEALDKAINLGHGAVFLPSFQKSLRGDRLHKALGGIERSSGANVLRKCVGALAKVDADLASIAEEDRARRSTQEHVAQNQPRH